MFILYVANQHRSRDFYSAVLGIDPVLDVPGMTEFLFQENMMIGLMPEDGIARILGDSMPHPSQGAGIPRCELYFTVEDPEEFLSRAVQHGATPISPVAQRTWGDVVGYCADADGHVLAFSKKL